MCTDNTSPYERMRTFFSLRATLRTIHPMHLHWHEVFLRSCVCFSKGIPSASTSLLGVLEFTPFFLVFISVTTTPTPLIGIRLNPCATPLWGGQSGHLADPFPYTRIAERAGVLEREHQNRAIPTPRVATKFSAWNLLSRVEVTHPRLL